jgi:glycosyltransferase involved in cell wall biosynthesis
LIGRDTRPADVRIVFWGLSDAGKPRVRLLRDGLRRNGVEVLECRADLWTGIEDKSQIGSVATWLRLCWRALAAYPVLVWRYMRLPRHDWVLLGYPAIPDIFVIRLFAWMRGSRVAFDWFLSAYDTIVLDRKLAGPGNPVAWIIRAVEWMAVRLADCAFMDTQTHARRMERIFGLRPHSCGSVFVGAEADFFHDAPTQSPRRGPPFKVLFYGQFIPLHGVPTIIEAARRIRGAPVDWLLIGAGQEDAAVRRMLDADPLSRMRWLPWVPYDRLHEYIAEADVCLGIFGQSEKAASVIPNKVFQALASGKTVVTRDSPAIRELPADLLSTITLVPAAAPDALASCIMDLARAPDPRPSAPASRSALSAHAIGKQLLAVLRRCSHGRPHHDQ